MAEYENSAKSKASKNLIPTLARFSIASYQPYANTIKTTHFEAFKNCGHCQKGWRYNTSTGTTGLRSSETSTSQGFFIASTIELLMLSQTTWEVLQVWNVRSFIGCSPRSTMSVLLRISLRALPHGLRNARLPSAMSAWESVPRQATSGLRKLVDQL